MTDQYWQPATGHARAIDFEPPAKTGLMPHPNVNPVQGGRLPDSGQLVAQQVREHFWNNGDSGTMDNH